MSEFDILYEGIMSTIKDMMWPKEEPGLDIDYKKMLSLEDKTAELKQKASEEVKSLLDTLEKAFYVWGTPLVYHTSQNRVKLSMFPDFFKVLSQIPHIQSTLPVAKEALTKLKKIKGYENFCKIVEPELNHVEKTVKAAK